MKNVISFLGAVVVLGSVSPAYAGLEVVKLPEVKLVASYKPESLIFCRVSLAAANHGENRHVDFHTETRGKMQDKIAYTLAQPCGEITHVILPEDANSRYSFEQLYGLDGVVPVVVERILITNPSLRKEGIVIAMIRINRTIGTTKL